jgi:crotonobetainyl-CoA:carnitine CoA-transferase CaiB-like acyl-CoA transferase
MGMEEYIEDPRFATMDDRTQNNTELVEIIDRQFATKTFDEWDKTFREAGDFIYSRVQEIEELQDDPQVIANDYITTFNHPVLGAVKMCNHPVTYSETPAGIFREAPELGQHTEEILIDELGYDWPDIERLKDKGAIL